MYYYAGIGSRETPPDVLLRMQEIGRCMAHRDWVLRSGGARGADTAFETGCDSVGGSKAIFLPSLTIPEWAFIHASALHPNWAACSDYARRCHARNVLIILGATQPEPVDAVSIIICWTPNGAITGGTGQALRMAPTYNIPVWNLATDPAGSVSDYVTLATRERS